MTSLFVLSSLVLLLGAPDAVLVGDSTYDGKTEVYLPVRRTLHRLTVDTDKGPAEVFCSDGYGTANTGRCDLLTDVTEFWCYADADLEGEDNVVCYVASTPARNRPN